MEQINKQKKSIPSDRSMPTNILRETSMSRIIVNKTTIVIKCSIAADAKKEKQTWEQNK